LRAGRAWPRRDAWPPFRRYDGRVNGPQRRAAHVLLLTGVPGVGKTTIIRQLAAALAGRRLAGFYTEEIRVAGERHGFRAVTFDGRERVMAHTSFGGRQRVGKYGVDLDAIDDLAESALRVSDSTEVYLVDEIGKMECLSPRFVAAVRALLDGRAPVLATVARAGSGLIADVKQRQGAELWEVTRANRDAVPGRALVWLQSRPPNPPPDARASSRDARPGM
jgi:nucleoside-triphosphatase